MNAGKKSRSLLWVGVLFVGVAAAVVAAAMFAGDHDSEELTSLNLKRQWTRNPRMHTGGLYIHGAWRGLSFVEMPGTEGVVVTQVQGAGARRAGLLRGDRIVAVDRKEVTNISSLARVSQRVAANNTLLLDIRRGGQPMTLILPPAAQQQQRQQQRQQAGPTASGAWGKRAWGAPARGWAGNNGQATCPRCGRPLAWPQTNNR